MTERRYREDEVREIFGMATSGKVPEAPAANTADGLTLADIQSIGLEVGLEPDLVARAASALDNRPARPARKSLGMPIEVGRVVPLPRALNDREWELLVAELRTTFKARGRVTGSGGLREWSNGNLHASMEPTDTGYRIRLGTLKGDAVGVNAAGAIGVGAGTVLFASLAISGGLSENLFGPWLLSMGGVGAFVTNLVRLPRWARQREKQMDYMVARIKSIIDATPKGDVDT